MLRSASFPDSAVAVSGGSMPELVEVSSDAFGSYYIPLSRLQSMTASHITDEVGGVCGAGGGVGRHSAVVHVDAELDGQLRLLQCGRRLRADMPVLWSNQVASLVSKCWTYLVWMHLIRTDSSTVDASTREKVVWWMMRPFEQDGGGDECERTLKTKIKKGLRLTELLLSHPAHLALVGQLGHVSSDGICRLTHKELSIVSLRTLASLTVNGGRPSVTKHNIQRYLLTATDELEGEEKQVATAANGVRTSHESTTAALPRPFAELMRRVLPSSSVAATPSSSTTDTSGFDSSGSDSSQLTAPARRATRQQTTQSSGGVNFARHALDQATSSALEDEVAERYTEVEERAEEGGAGLVEEQGKGEEEPEQGEEECAEAESEAEDGADSEDNLIGNKRERSGTDCELDEDDRDVDIDGRPQAAVSTTRFKDSVARNARRSRKTRKRPRQQPASSKRKTARVEAAAETQTQRAQHDDSLSSTHHLCSPHLPLFKRPTLRDASAALERLAAVTFREPDAVYGCEAEHDTHDLFCRHHVEWRGEALRWLATLSTAELQAMSEQHTVSLSTSVDEQYLQLARRWGQRIQFVAPVLLRDDATMKQALQHVSLELEMHDAGWRFHSHDDLPRLLSRRKSSSSTAREYVFSEPDMALPTADPRKVWVFASDHERDTPGANSAHMLAVYRRFSGCEAASFDADCGVDARVPLGLFLRLGVMLVVAVQTEGSCVYVPSAEANESAHLVTTVSDRAAVSVAGNVLGPRHVARLIRQHEADGPSEAVRLAWATSFRPAHGTAAVADQQTTELYTIQPGELQLHTPTAATIDSIHRFLSQVKAYHQCYQPEYYRQSWIPDLFSTSQACRVLSEHFGCCALPPSLAVQQLQEAGRLDNPLTRSALAALTTRAVSFSLQQPPADWHECAARFGCPGHVAQSDTTARRVHSIRRPPLLLVMPADTTQQQETLVRHAHDMIARAVVKCNSYKAAQPRQDGQHTRDEPEYDKWPNTVLDSKAWRNRKKKLTARWMSDTLAAQGAVYLTDVVTDSALCPDTTTPLVEELIGEQTAAGFLLRHCRHKGDGVHSPSFFAMFSSTGSEENFTPPHHNESHRVAAWHLLLRHPKRSSTSAHYSFRSRHSTASSSHDSSPSSFYSSPSPPASSASADASLIFHALAAKSALIAGSDHLLDGIEPVSAAEVVDGVKRSARVLQSGTGMSERERYPKSVSLAFGELTEESGYKVLAALGMSASSRLLDIGSAFGRFSVQAALAAPRGASVTGVEVGIARAQHAAKYLSELRADHRSIMERCSVELLPGDILDQLALLFTHSHVFIFDERFVECTWRVIAHLLSYMAGVTKQRVISCQALHTVNPDLLRGEPVPLTLSAVAGGSQSFTGYVYTIDERARACHKVEVCRDAVHGLGLRAARTLRCGQVVMAVEGVEVGRAVFDKLATVSKRAMFPHLIPLPSSRAPKHAKGERVYMYAENASRFVNSCHGSAQPHNVAFRCVDGHLLLVAVADIRRGQELLADYHNWSLHGDDEPWERE